MITAPRTKRVVRIVIYEGASDWVDTTLARSLADGVMHLAYGTIAVETLIPTDRPFSIRDGLGREDHHPRGTP